MGTLTRITTASVDDDYYNDGDRGDLDDVVIRVTRLLCECLVVVTKAITKKSVFV